jgi:hypothetical protein
VAERHTLMGSKSSATKTGVRSSSIKRSTTRHTGEEAPRTRSKPGAYAREGLDRETQGKLKTPSRDT